MDDLYYKTLEELEQTDNLRAIPIIEHDGEFIKTNNKHMLNLSSNDYLGLSSDISLRGEFLEATDKKELLFSSSSSRLLTGNFKVYERTEKLLADMFSKEAALIFNSGYHMNLGILPALADKSTLIVADKLVHASIIDGIRLSTAHFERYRHNDNLHLQRIIEANASIYQRIIIVTESIFSMDGDEADLQHLVEIKKRYPNVMLYVDEAHAFGTRGTNGLGLAEEKNCVKDIDLLCGTFGKAAAGMGGYIICSKVIRDYLVNKMRPLIFSTALPPANILWTEFIIKKLPEMNNRREHLKKISSFFKEELEKKGYHSASSSNIIPMITGKSSMAIEQAKRIQSMGFYVLPLRPPTVPEGTSRLRFSLTAAMSNEDIERLSSIINSNKI